MKYRYNIAHSVSGKKTVINFKNKKSLEKYLESKYDKVNELERVYINFAAISLPLKSTVWYVDPNPVTVTPTPVNTKPKPANGKPAVSKKKQAEQRRLKRFIKRLERR